MIEPKGVGKTKQVRGDEKTIEVKRLWTDYRSEAEEGGVAAIAVSTVQPDNKAAITHA